MQVNKLAFVNNEEIRGDTINSIHQLSMEKMRSSLLVHTRDNCIRRLNYEKRLVLAAHADHRQILRRVLFQEQC